MFNLMKGLKAREEMLNELRFLFRNEDQLIKEGWLSESEFFETVVETVLDAVKEMVKE